MNNVTNERRTRIPSFPYSLIFPFIFLYIRIPVYPYHMYTHIQWSSIGLTANLYWALGVVPFKDDFWSEETQPGNRWGTNTAKEADAELQTVVSALTAGEMRGRGRGREEREKEKERERERRRHRVVLCVYYATV